MLKRYARFECEACGRSCRDEYYMLRTELWQEACRSNNMLCIGCVEDRLGRKLVLADFNLEDTHDLIKLWPPARRLKHRLGISWDKRLTRVLAVICAKVLTISAKFLSVMRRAFTAARRARVIVRARRARDYSLNLSEAEGPEPAEAPHICRHRVPHRSSH